MLTTLLSNLLFLIFPVFVIYVFGIDPRKGTANQTVHALLCSVSLLLCELIPIPLTDGYGIKLQFSILIIASLYGGHFVSAVLTAVLIVLHLTVGQNMIGDSWLSDLLLFLLLQLCIPRFWKYGPRTRVLLVSGFSTLSVLVPLFTYVRHIHAAEEAACAGIGGHLLLGLAIQAVSAGFTAAFIEAMRRQIEMREELTQLEKLQVISDLAASVSHEVRNPLTVSRGFLQLLLERSAGREPESRYVKLALEEMQRAEHIITDYLSYAKPEAERVVRLAIQEELRYVTGVLESYALIGKVEIRLLQEGGGEVLGDRQKLRQCLINLMKNGIEAMPQGGLLEVSAVCSQQQVHIVIQDNGGGMTPEEVRRLGTPYYTTKTKGTGLGTMVAFSIVRAMNGRIEVTSRKGEGTRFELKLPAC
ncbi:two-component system, sporulation sensor kinase B [Paenibacillus sp. UNCCL117]|uniref:ATP-binding protein n=1 Tax=unclassified Paenibacillus TaxID=185978 RepID=UPI00088FEA27|nr:MULTISPECIES: ATP-binding protein [unclassified Paenibacillus]SDE07224.1 two-component system, sporulation sensor kinase B [Paenibacillus sp. cl123]SFW59211.1 two-component system, sporulation sensor kinase B [Paenibacillus sp. UNCCL117]